MRPPILPKFVSLSLIVSGFVLFCEMSLDPTEKAPEIEALINSMFDIDRRGTIKSRKCAFCSVSVDENDFRDELSKKEYTISGICQDCQDKTFG